MLVNKAYSACDGGGENGIFSNRLCSVASELWFLVPFFVPAILLGILYIPPPPSIFDQFMQNFIHYRTGAGGDHLYDRLDYKRPRVFFLYINSIYQGGRY